MAPEKIYLSLSSGISVMHTYRHTQVLEYTHAHKTILNEFYMVCFLICFCLILGPRCKCPRIEEMVCLKYIQHFTYTQHSPWLVLINTP